MFASGSAPPELLTDGHSVPLAVNRDGPGRRPSRPLPPGSTLLLYTDGLVERRDDPSTNRSTASPQVVSDTVDLPVEAVADAILTRLAPAAGYDDDVAIVVYRCTPRPLCSSMMTQHPAG